MTVCVNISSIDSGDQDAALGVTLKSAINQVFLPAVCVFGVVGNLLNLAILTRRKLQKSFRTLEQAANLCLVALALSDLMFCVSAFLTVFLPSDRLYSNSGFWLLYGKFNVAIINIFIMESTMLTVAMSLERYLAICFPLRQDIYLTTTRIKFVIFFTFIFSVGFNIPVFWRYETVTVCSGISSDPTLNLSSTFKDVTSLVPNLTPETHSQPDLGIDAILTSPNSLQMLPNVANNRNTTLQLQSLHKNASVLPTETPSFFSSAQLSSNYTLRSSAQLSSNYTLRSSAQLSSNYTLRSSAQLSSNYTLQSSAQLSSNYTLQSSAQLSSNYTLQSSFTSQASSYLTTYSPKSSSVSINLPKTENKTLYTIKLVLLYGNHVYDTTYRLVWAFVGNFIPLVLLFFFNVCLCRQIYSSYKLRKHLGRQHRARSSSNSLTITLVAIVVLFFILVAPTEVTLQVSHMTSSGDTPLYNNIEAVLNLMQAINFSVNFILYCIISPHFRKTLKYMMCWWCQFRHQNRDFNIKFKNSSM